jgi:predicted metal-dependent HD superfamily phosphohydrolase
MTSLEQSWSRAWQNLKLPPPVGLLDQLQAAYCEPQRHYHTQQHLQECLSHFTAAMDAATHPGEVEIALWFHDAVYDIHGHNNEHLSAQWAVQALAQAGADSSVTQRVLELIMATCHDAAPTGPDQQLLVDIDLSILGAPAARFDEYDRQVQAEYSWVPSDMYRAKRKEILISFLGRPFIYSTPHFRDRYEMQARANLTQCIKNQEAR